MVGNDPDGRYLDLMIMSYQTASSPASNIVHSCTTFRLRPPNSKVDHHGRRRRVSKIGYIGYFFRSRVRSDLFNGCPTPITLAFSR